MQKIFARNPLFFFSSQCATPDEVTPKVVLICLSKLSSYLNNQSQVLNILDTTGHCCTSRFRTLLRISFTLIMVCSSITSVFYLKYCVCLLILNEIAPIPPTLGSRIYKERVSSDMKSAYNIVCLLLIFSRNIFCPVYTELGQTQFKMELHITLISVELVSLDLIGWVDFVL